MPGIMDEINERLRLERGQQQQAASSHSTSPQPEQHTDSPSNWEFPTMTTSHGAQRPFMTRHRRERSRSMEFTSVSSTLGRRNREPLELEEWSTPAKRQLTDFAQEVCADLGVPVEQRDMIIEKSKVRLMTTNPQSNTIAS